MKYLFYLSVCLPFLTCAQVETKEVSDLQEPGIWFEQGQTLEQVLAKAKTENKFVFVDCYATWCGPCKEMDKNVYPLEKVGKYLNNKFISVKMQMDSSKNDKDAIKIQYADALYIREKYKIDAYPSFLFFTPDGKIINRSKGAKDPDGFIALAAEVLDPKKNYYVLMTLFQQGERDLSAMSFLARRGMVLGDTMESRQVAKEYINQVNKKSLLTRENIEFMREFTQSSEEIGFKLFYQHADSIDKIMGDDTYSRQFVQSILYKEIVMPEFDKTKQSPDFVPNWSALRAIISKKYNQYYSDRVITAARASWGLDQKNWPEYTKYLVRFQETYGSRSNKDVMASLILNNYAWAIFLYSNDSEELNKALAWSNRAVMMCPSPNWMDTYANILYKLGRKNESVMWEEVASKLNPNDKEIQATLEKMKKGAATLSSQ